MQTGYRRRSIFLPLQIQKIRFQTTEYCINIAFYRLKLMEIPLLTSFGFGSPNGSLYVHIQSKGDFDISTKASHKEPEVWNLENK